LLRDVRYAPIAVKFRSEMTRWPISDILRAFVISCILTKRCTLMGEPQIRYDDGAAYERMMGTWSRAAGQTFLDWLAPKPGLRWIDIGCGNGAFTELLIERCAPSEVEGVDPSEAQLLFARGRPAGQIAKFHQGDALALPFFEASFDVAIMALVIFFVPDPAKGVAEMTRVVGPGGTVAAYVWDMTRGGRAGFHGSQATPFRDHEPGGVKAAVEGRRAEGN
jgi:SAM-dependent methyltransferase